MSILHCLACGGEGRIFKSKWDAGKCEACDGSGNHPCDSRGCENVAVGFDDDGNPMCEDCLMEAAMDNGQFGVGA